MDKYYIEHNGEVHFVSIEDVDELFEDCSITKSHGIIMDYRVRVEEKLPETHCAPATDFMVDGKLVVPNVPDQDCLAAAFYIYNGYMPYAGSPPYTKEYILAHIYHVLVSYFPLDDGFKHTVNCDKWECYQTENFE